MKATIDPLFIGVYPGGIVYADRRKEEGGDYKRIAFLGFLTLDLSVSDPKNDQLPAICRHANALRAKKGEQYQISACGQTVLLGGGLRK